MICQACKRQLPDNARFCDACGTPVTQSAPVENAPVETAPVETAPVENAPVENAPVESAPKAAFCSKCGTSLTEADKFCSKCGALAQASASASAAAPSNASAPSAVSIGIEGSNGYKKPFKFSKKLIAIGSSAIAAVLILVLVLSLVFSGNGKANHVLYRKDDGGVYYANLSKISPLLLTDEITSTVAEPFIGYLNYVTKDGKTIFYAEDISLSSYSATIYYRPLNDSKAESKKLDSDITRYLVSADGKTVVYIKGDDKDLYITDLNEKTKIASDVKSVFVTQDCKTMLYYTVDEDLYVKKGNNEPERVDVDVTSILSVSEDLTQCFYYKSEELYKYQNLSEKEKIASGDSLAVYFIYDDNTFYYSVSTSQELKLSEFVEDDMLAVDANIVRPEYPSYPSRPYSFMFDSQEEYLAAYAQYELDLESYSARMDKYREDLDAYYDKTSRDSLRESLESSTYTKTSTTLYYYDGTKSVELARDSFLNSSFPAYLFDTPVIFYAQNAQSTTATEKIKLSSVKYAYQVREQIEDAVSDSKIFKLAYKDKSFDFENEINTLLGYSEKSSTLYYTVKSEDGDNDYTSCAVYKISISEAELGKAEIFAQDVYGDSLAIHMFNGELVYYKNVDDREGDLYVGDKMLDSNVLLSNISSTCSEDTIAYFVDWRSGKDLGTLKCYANNKVTEIAQDTHSVDFTSAGEMLYITDYSYNHGSGTLYAYNNGRPQKIDEDVEAIIPFFSTIVHRFY